MFSFSVSISYKISLGSDVNSRFRNVLTITDLFWIKEFNVSGKTSEDILNSADSFTKFHTFSVLYFFLFLYSVCIDEIMRSVSSSSVIVMTNSESRKQPLQVFYKKRCLLWFFNELLARDFSIPAAVKTFRRLLYEMAL